MKFDFLQSQLVADAVIERLRSGIIPADSDVPLLDAMPLIDLLRRRVASEDAPLLLRLLRESSDAIAGFSVSLLRNQMQDSHVRRAMEEAWWVATPSVKNRLLWRLADCADLDEQWRQRFFEFILAEWETFQTFNRRFYGSPEAALTNLVKRIGDPSFLKSKIWLYLCSVPAVVDDPETLKAIVNIARAMAGSSVEDVANLLLDGALAAPTRSPTQRNGTDASSLTACSYIADAVYIQLRSGRMPADAEADWLNRVPIIDELRSRVSVEDIPQILAQLDTAHGEPFGLLLSLLRKFTHGAKVKSWLQSKWISSDPFGRAHLMWRILDDPELPEEWHQKLFAFVMDNWTTFQRVSLKFLGTPETIVVQALKRVADPSFPETKKWAYLCRVPGVADDHEAACALLRLGLQSSDPFTRHVADQLLDRFFPGDPRAERGINATA